MCGAQPQSAASTLAPQTATSGPAAGRTERLPRAWRAQLPAARAPPILRALRGAVARSLGPEAAPLLAAVARAPARRGVSGWICWPRFDRTQQTFAAASGLIWCFLRVFAALTASGRSAVRRRHSWTHAASAASSPLATAAHSPARRSSAAQGAGVGSCAASSSSLSETSAGHGLRGGHAMHVCSSGGLRGALIAAAGFTCAMGRVARQRSSAPPGSAVEQKAHLRALSGVAP